MTDIDYCFCIVHNYKIFATHWTIFATHKLVATIRLRNTAAQSYAKLAVVPSVAWDF
jgi:hypothetical protein